MRESHQKLIIGSSAALPQIDRQTVDLVVTSPPYPMVAMWDESLGVADPMIGKYLEAGRGREAFEAMHQQLDKVWQEMDRLMKPGGVLCINIGDATRTLKGNFQLYSNHSRILNAGLKLGWQVLPAILWRKPTNAPNKFMGSGMLPAGAYVTLEHEYILVFRKGGKREFKTAESKALRRESAFFWEERNSWFSDVWEMRGTGQQLGAGKGRDRSAAYPFELAYRLINMFSMKGDCVIDPFLGTGTTLRAASLAGRNSIGVELEKGLATEIMEGLSSDNLKAYQDRIALRLKDHEQFIADRIAKKGEGSIKHTNSHYGFPVMTAQEKDLILDVPQSVEQHDLETRIRYSQ